MGEQPPADHSIVALFTRLIDDAERFVRAEIRLYRAQLFARLGEARTALLLGLVALLLAQAALIGMIVGLLLILLPLLGPIWATILLVSLALAVAALLARIALGKIRRITEIRDRIQ